jgi:hypothetical protein
VTKHSTDEISAALTGLRRYFGTGTITGNFR